MSYFYSTMLTLFAWAATAQTTWYPVASGTQQKLNCISFGTDLVGYIGGEDSLLLKTLDGGKTWNRIAVNSPMNAWYRGVTDIQFLDELNGYAVINNAIYRTTDGAATWISEQPNNTNMCFKNALFFHDFQNGYVGGAMCFQGATIANKVAGNWDTVKVIGGWNSGEHITNFDFRNSLLGMASSSENSLFRTTNGGLTWDTISTDFDTTAISDVVFVNDTLVYATYEATGLEGAIVSFDAGLTWQRDLGLATFAYPGFSTAIVTNSEWLFLGGFPSWGNGGIIFNKTPLWWDYSIVDQRISAMATYGDSTVFAVGDSGYIVVNKLPANIGLQEQEQSSISVFPNPFNYKISITGIQSESELHIFDIGGKLIKTVALQSNRETISVEELPHGVYIFEIVEKSGTSVFKLMK